MHLLIAVLTKEKVNKIDQVAYEKICANEDTLTGMFYEEYCANNWKECHEKHQKLYKENEDLRNNLFKDMHSIVDNKIKEKYYNNSKDIDGEDYFYYNTYKVCGNWTDALDLFGYKTIEELKESDNIRNEFKQKDNIDSIVRSFAGYIDLDDVFHSVSKNALSELNEYDRSVFRKYLEDNSDMYIIPIDIHM